MGFIFLRCPRFLPASKPGLGHTVGGEEAAESRAQEVTEGEALRRSRLLWAEGEGVGGEGARKEKVSRFEARALFLTLGSHLTNQEAS